jgi:hypothetical protein
MPVAAPPVHQRQVAGAGLHGGQHTLRLALPTQQVRAMTPSYACPAIDPFSSMPCPPVRPPAHPHPHSHPCLPVPHQHRLVGRRGPQLGIHTRQPVVHQALPRLVTPHLSFSPSYLSPSSLSPRRPPSSSSTCDTLFRPATAAYLLTPAPRSPPSDPILISFSLTHVHFLSATAGTWARPGPPPRTKQP